jgi:Flp pilus assembly protein TadD
MSTHLPRGILLYQQDRYALAEQELRLAVAEEPEDPTAHGFLALCLAEQGKLDPAEDEAKLAIRYGPDDPFAHSVLAHVLFKRGRPAEAERAARESLRLDPTDAHTYSILAAVRHDRRDWRGALEAAEDGLAHDPNHPGCTAARTLALLQLGRAGDAGAAAADALRRNPDDPLAHTAQGWAELHAGRPKEALTHFREALRLDPTSEWARQGMIEALKARYWLYRQMLRFFLWMGRLSRRAQWGVILGLLLAQQVLGRLADANPTVRPFVLPVLFGMIGFALLTWLSVPLFNLLLRLNKYGRYALNHDQRRQSHWVAGVLVAGLIALAFWLFGHGTFGVVAVVGEYTTFTCFFLLVPVSAVFRVPRGWPRWVMIAYTAAMVVVWAVMVGCFLEAADLLGRRQQAAARASFDSAVEAFTVNVWATLGAGFLANGLATVRRRR